MLDKLKNKISEMANSVNNYNFGGLKLSEKQRNDRLEICKQCENLSKHDFCNICSCYMPAKTYIANQSCPIKKWIEIKVV